MGLFQPAWMGKSKTNALAAVKKLEKEKQLFKAVLRSPHEAVRKEALKRIADQELVKKILLESENSYIRAQAVEKISDQAWLRDFIANRPEDYVRVLAVCRLTDQTALEAVAAGDQDAACREVAIKRLDNKELLRQIAGRESCLACKRAAYSRLGEDEMARYLACTDAKLAMNKRREAVDGISDEQLLLDIVRDDSLHLDLRERAAKRLLEPGNAQQALLVLHGYSLAELIDSLLTIIGEEPSLLRETSEQLPDGHARTAALISLGDQVLIASAVMKWNGTDSQLYKLIQNLNDPALLAQVTFEAKPPAAGREAVQKITDQTVLLRVIEKLTDTQTRRNAVAQLTDQAAIVAIARREDDANVRLEAVGRISDPLVARDIALHDTDTACILKSLERLSSAQKAEVVAEMPDARAAGMLPLLAAYISNEERLLQLMPLGDTEGQTAALNCLKREETLKAAARSAALLPSARLQAIFRMEKTTGRSLLAEFADEAIITELARDWDTHKSRLIALYKGSERHRARIQKLDGSRSHSDACHIGYGHGDYDSHFDLSKV